MLGKDFHKVDLARNRSAINSQFLRLSRRGSRGESGMTQHSEQRWSHRSLTDGAWLRYKV